MLTEVKERKEAEAEYREAVDQGHSAVLAKQTQQSASLYQVDLGNLGAMQEAVVKVTYLRLLDTFARTLEFSHTATWVPPYLSAADLAQPPDRVLASAPKFSTDVSYKLSYEVRIVSPAGVRSVDCAQDGAVVRDGEVAAAAVGFGAAVAGGGGGACCKVVTLTDQVSDPAKDFQLLIELPEAAAGARSKLLLQSCKRGAATKTVALAAFIPPLASSPLSEAAAAAAATKAAGGDSAAAGGAAAKKEIIFVIDCSGSMGGDPIQQAREAALYFVKDLPAGAGTTFNVVLFGSTWRLMYPESRPYDGATEKQAVTWIEANVDANMGGTEILATLQSFYGTPVRDGYERQVIFLTDGGITGSEEQQVYDLVDPNSAAAPPAARRTAVFCLGIGHGVHRGLLHAMSSRTGGAVQYVTESADIVKKCGFLKKCALSADALTRPRLVARSCLLRLAPAALPPRIFGGEPVHVLAEVLKAQPGAELVLTAQGRDGRSVELPLPLDPSAAVPGEALAVLHGMSYISALYAGTSHLHVTPDGSPQEPPPDAETVKAAVIKAAVEENLVTPETAAVGVLLQRDPLDPAAVKRLEVPLKVPHGRKLWEAASQQQQQQMPMAMFCGSAAPMMMSAAPMMMRSMMPMQVEEGEEEDDAPVAACAMPAPAPAPMAGATRNKRLVGGRTAPMDKMAFASALPPPPPPPGGAVFDAVPFGPAVCGMAAPDDAGAAEHGVVAMDVDELSGSGGDANVLRRLNKERTTEGWWHSSDRLLALLTARRLAAEQSSGSAVQQSDDEVRARLVKTVADAKPDALSAEKWATLLVLAYLKRYMSADHAAWEGMESKATVWLLHGGGTWPAACKSIGVTVLQAMKLL